MDMTFGAMVFLKQTPLVGFHFTPNLFYFEELIMSKSKQVSIEKQFEKVGCSVTFRNRSGKLYCKIQNTRRFTDFRLARGFLDVRDILETEYPDSYVTSGGYLGWTFRLNPDKE